MRRFVTAMAAALLAIPAVAAAQDYTEDVYQTEGEEVGKRSLGIMGEVGIDNWTRGLSDEVDVGVAYGARLDISPLRNVGVELLYAGSVADLSSDISADGRLIKNQIGGDLRLNLVPPKKELPANLMPFVFGGAAYHRMDVDNFAPGFRDNIDAFAIPVGGGFETEIGERFLLGARFQYNFLFNEEDSLPRGDDADDWTVTANLGTRLGG